MMRTLFYNGTLLLPGGEEIGGSILAEDDVIAAVYGPGQNPLDAQCMVDLQGDFLAPGFIDVHVHGGGGGDFMDGTVDSFDKVLSLHLAHGTTALCPTTLTATLEELEQVFDTYRFMDQALKAALRPRLLGVHLEGPYIAPAMKGAQDDEFVRMPDDGSCIALLERAKDVLRIWTAAPEIGRAHV